MSVLYYASIAGNPIVKKNNQHVSFRGPRPTKYNTPAYTRWLRSANYQLNYSPTPDSPIDEPVILLCKFFMQSRRRVDLSALYEGIQDLLVKRGVLADDNSNIVIGHDGSRVYYDKDNPRMEISVLRADPC